MKSKTRYPKLGNYFMLWLFALTNPVLSQEQEQDTNFPYSHIIEVEEGVNLHIVDWGGQGSPLLFVPSWSSTSHIFDNFAPRFTDEYRVLVMDIRGHGESSRPDHGYTIDRLTKDIEVVLGQLGIQRTNLVGLSRSASLITQFAARYPEHIETLIYLSGPIDREYDRAFRARPGMRDLRRQRGISDDELMALCNIVDEERPFPEGSDDDAANEFGVEWRNMDPSPPYSEIKAPAIAFWSLTSDREHLHMRSCSDIEDQGRVQELRSKFTKAALPFYEKQAHDIGLFEQNMENGTIRIIPGSDYNTYLTHPELVEEEIRAFLSAYSN